MNAKGLGSKAPSSPSPTPRVGRTVSSSRRSSAASRETPRARRRRRDAACKARGAAACAHSRAPFCAPRCRAGLESQRRWRRRRGPRCSPQQQRSRPSMGCVRQRLRGSTT
eukprot:Amastigsp_a521543_2.p2 type:complete len:111 gc:universal Amastigsp_a521543_2:66-398(+)